MAACLCFHAPMKKGPRKPIAYLALAVVLFAAALFFLRVTILSAVGNFLVVSDPLAKSDAIAILGGNGASRAAEAAKLFGEGWAPRILISREGYPFKAQEWKHYGITRLEESDVAALVLKNLGVSDHSVVLLDGYNENTLDEVRNYRAYLESTGQRSVIVVTSNFHSRRSRLTFRRVFRGTGIRVIVHPAPANFEYAPEYWWRRRISRRTAYLEYQKLIFYALFYR